MLMRRENARMTGAASAVLGGTFVIWALARATDGFTDGVTRIMPTTVLGLVCGVALLVAAFGILSARLWGWKASVGAHLLSIVAVLFGIAVATRYEYENQPNMTLPIVLLALLCLSLVALWRARPRNPIRRAQHEIAARMY